MSEFPLNILLADDDEDDCIFFEEALKELPVSANLVTVHNGEQLMQLLAKPEASPDVLFLDLNMPGKNGFECLTEIKHLEKLRSLPVVIYSTSLDHHMVNLLYEGGAQYYVRKPGNFSKLKKVIQEALTMATYATQLKPPKEKFIISV